MTGLGRVRGSPDPLSGSSYVFWPLSCAMGILEGTFLDAGVDAAIVLIIPGSGPTDRNGDGPNGRATSTCRFLAEDLMTRGISSIRIDKRGMSGSAQARNTPNDVIIDAYIEDVASWTTSPFYTFGIGSIAGILRDICRIFAF